MLLLWSSSFIRLSWMWLESSSAFRAPEEAADRRQLTACQNEERFHGYSLESAIAPSSPTAADFTSARTSGSSSRLVRTAGSWQRWQAAAMQSAHTHTLVCLHESHLHQSDSCHSPLPMSAAHAIVRATKASFCMMTCSLVAMEIRC